jgi:hypothetical protein
MVMGKTIIGAASGETAISRRRRIHNLRQKDRRMMYNSCVHFSYPRDWSLSNLFLFYKTRWKKWKEDVLWLV